MSGRRNGLILAIALVISSLGIVRAQDLAPADMVYVSVKVTDASGRPVTGLMKEDFGITEESIEQVVTFLGTSGQNPEYEYRIGYVPKNGTKDGGWRRIRVRVISPAFVGKRLSVLSTAGYYAR